MWSTAASLIFSPLLYDQLIIELPGFLFHHNIMLLKRDCAINYNSDFNVPSLNHRVIVIVVDTM